MLTGGSLEAETDGAIFGKTVAGGVWKYLFYTDSLILASINVECVCRTDGGYSTSTMVFDMSTYLSKTDITHRFVGADVTQQMRLVVIAVPMASELSTQNVGTALTATAATNVELTQTFVPTVNGSLQYVYLALELVGATMQVDVCGDVTFSTGNRPEATRLSRSTSVTDMGIYAGAKHLYRYAFANNVARLDMGVTYAIKFKATAGSFNYSYANPGGYASGNLWIGDAIASTSDVYFQVHSMQLPMLTVYLKGPTGSTTDVKVCCTPRDSINFAFMDDGSGVWPDLYPSPDVRYDTSLPTTYPPSLQVSNSLTRMSCFPTTTQTVEREVQLLGTVRNGTSPPTPTTLGNFMFYSFSASQANYMFSTLDMPHDWAIGTPLEIHIHWCCNSIVAGNVVWELMYNVAPIGDNFNMTGTTLPVVIVANDTVNLYKHMYTTLNRDMDMSTITTDGMIVNMRLTRRGNDPLDNYGNTVYLFSWGCHYQSNRVGSVFRY